MIIRLLLIFFVLLGSMPAFAETITYSGIIRDALDNSAKVKTRIEEIRIADASYRELKGELFPQISANARFEKYRNLIDGQNITVSGDVVTGQNTAWNSVAYLSGQYSLSSWYRKRYDVGYNEKLREVRFFDCQSEEKKLIRELNQLYSALAEGKSKLDWSEKILRKLQEILALKRTACEHGEIALEKVIRSEADVAAREKEISSLKKEFEENLGRLAGYTGKPYAYNPAVEMISSRGADFPETREVVENTPEYKSGKKELEAVQLKKKGVSYNFLPDISLYGRYDVYGSNPDNLDSSWRAMRPSDYVVGMQISLPLFDGGTRKWARERQSAEVRRQEQDMKSVSEERNREIKSLNAGYRELLKAQSHYRNLVEQYGKMLAIAQKAQALGETSRIDIALMEKDCMEVERDLEVSGLSLAAYERRLMLETNYENFIREFNGNRTCKY